MRKKVLFHRLASCGGNDKIIIRHHDKSTIHSQELSDDWIYTRGLHSGLFS